MENPGSGLEDFQKRHTPMYDRDQLAAAVAEFNNKINGCGFYFSWDKESERSYISYRELPDDVLMIISSFDFCYYYDLEIAFHGIIHHDLEDEGQWPDHWSKDQLVLYPAPEAQQYMLSLGFPADPSVHLFGFNIGSHTDNTYFILAKGLSIHTGTVFYYDRLAQEPLKDGQRVAYWARSSKK